MATETTAGGAAEADAASEEAVDGDVLLGDEPADEVAEAAAEGGADGALLSMFQESKLEVEDRSVIVELAGEVEMADLLEDLHTLALALALGVGAGAEQELDLELAA